MSQNIHIKIKVKVQIFISEKSQKFSKMSESSFQSASINFGFDNDIEMNFTGQTVKRGELHFLFYYDFFVVME